jgi:hypothetical protein
MSFCFRRKDPEGRIHIISTDIVGVAFALVPVTVGILLAMLLPWAQWLLSWTQGG